MYVTFFFFNLRNVDDTVLHNNTHVGGGERERKKREKEREKRERKREIEMEATV